MAAVWINGWRRKGSRERRHRWPRLLHLPRVRPGVNIPEIAARPLRAPAVPPASLASGTSGGYLFTIAPSAGGYAVTAVPKTYGSTGRRTFYTDQTGIIRQNWTQDPATVTSPELK